MPTPEDAAPSREVTWVAEYETAAQLMFTFFDWRHKMLVRYAVAVSALGLVVKYVFEKGFALWVEEIPFLLGAGLSCFVLLSEVVHRAVLDTCYEVGKTLESEARGDRPFAGVFEAMSQRVEYQKKDWSTYKPGGARWKSYRLLLSLLYGFGALGFVVAGIAYALTTG